MIENSDVLKIAGLSRLALTEEEVTLYSNQLSAILEHIEKLKELDTRDVGPTSHVLDIQNVMREDRTASSLAVDEGRRASACRPSGLGCRLHLLVGRLLWLRRRRCSRP